MTHDEDDVATLARALSLSDRFGLYVVLSDSPRAAEQACARALEAEGRSGVSVRMQCSTSAMWTEADATRALEQLRDTLDAWPAGPSVLVLDLSRALEIDTDALELLVARLNERRNGIVVRLGRSECILALPARLMPVLARAAPDLWSIRSSVFRVTAALTEGERELAAMPIVSPLYEPLGADQGGTEAWLDGEISRLESAPVGLGEASSVTSLHHTRAALREARGAFDLAAQDVARVRELSDQWAPTLPMLLWPAAFAAGIEVRLLARGGAPPGELLHVVERGKSLFLRREERASVEERVLDEFLLHAGHALNGAGDPSAARDVVAPLLDSADADTAMLARLDSASASLALGDRDAFHATLAPLVASERHESRTSARALLGEAALADGNTDLAVHELLTALATSPPHHPRVSLALARALALHGDAPRARLHALAVEPRPDGGLSLAAALTLPRTALALAAAPDAVAHLEALWSASRARLALHLPPAILQQLDAEASALGWPTVRA